MKLLVFGSSDTAGLLLADRSLAWPRLLQRELAQPVELAHVDLYASAAAADYVDRQLDRHQPDLVIVSLSAHGFVASSARQRVRQRFGPKVGKAYTGAADAFDRAASHLGVPGAIGARLAHRAARRTLGTAILTSYEAVLDAYMQVIRRLSRREDLQSLILGATWLGAEMWRLEPGAQGRIARFNDAVRAVAEEHHIAWVDCEAPMASAPDREACFLDILHKTPLGHRRIADALLAVLGPSN